MILASLDSFLSRPIAPTRRVALGSISLPVDPAPGFGGVLLGGIVARFARELDDEMIEEVTWLAAELRAGRRIPQPRLRHRLQTDRVGLQRSRHRLVGVGETVQFQLDEERGTPAQHVLCAVYAAGSLDEARRPAIFDAVARGLRWRGELGASLVAHLGGRGVDAGVSLVADPIGWAMSVLALGGVDRAAGVPTRHLVQRAYRDGLRGAHPDHGGDGRKAAERIAELVEARRILLTT